jgi:tetraacyldisaccharide 4'-kinase
VIEALVAAHAARRRRLAREDGRARLQRPVISIGNISMGGRGKTPAVAHLARLLVARGERPSILSRGYARRVVDDGVVVVSDGTHLLADVDRAGDEPLLLAREAPGAVVCVSEQRALAGVVAEARLGCTVHLLDDGFQHVDLARDLDLVLVAPEDFTDRVVPRGRLREPASALASADAVISDGEIDDVHRPVFRLKRRLGAPAPLEPERARPDALRSVVALSAIAGPDRFAQSLEAAGYRVADALAFRDHHRFTHADLARAAAAQVRTGADVIMTTTKDAMRILPLRPLPASVWAAPLVVSIEPRAEFERWFFARVDEVRR